MVRDSTANSWAKSIETDPKPVARNYKNSAAGKPEYLKNTIGSSVMQTDNFEPSHSIWDRF